MREYQLAHDVLDMERTVQALQRIINDSKARFSPEDIAFYRDVLQRRAVADTVADYKKGR